MATNVKSKYDKLSDQRKSIERALFDDAENNAINKTMAVFINSRAPFEQDVKGGNFKTSRLEELLKCTILASMMAW